MRLTKTQIEIIHDTLDRIFGDRVSVWLFGSRVDDSKRGGDVDIYIEPVQEKSLISVIQCKIALEEALDLHVDLIVKDPKKDRPIYNLAKTQGIQI